MSFFRPFRPLLVGGLFSLAGWSAFFGALAWQLSEAFPLSLVGALRMFGLPALLWALLTPLVFRLASRLPIERGRWWVAAPVHCAVGLGVLLGFNALSKIAGPARENPPPPRADGRGGDGPRRGGVLGWLLFGPQLPIYLALLSVAHARYYSQRSAERERRALELAASLAEARLQTLRMQIQPHFLFNSLNALAALIPKDPKAADEMLGALSDFLRLTLEDSGGQEVPLRRELEFAERYLEIEKARFGGRLDYSLDVPPDALAAMVPALVLQPLVENAVRHGIEPRREGGWVGILARREGDALCLAVSDDGLGIPVAPREGVGLANTRSRLRELHGGAASLSWKSENGARVEIRVPWRVA